MKQDSLNFKNLFKVIKYWKQHGFKETMKKWHYNYIMLETPESSLKKELFGQAGTMGGLLLAFVMLIANGVWYVSVAVFFGIYLTWINFKRTLQQLRQMRNIKEEFNKVGSEENKETEVKNV